MIINISLEAFAALLLIEFPAQPCISKININFSAMSFHHTLDKVFRNRPDTICAQSVTRAQHGIEVLRVNKVYELSFKLSTTVSRFGGRYHGKTCHSASQASQTRKRDYNWHPAECSARKNERTTEVNGINIVLTMTGSSSSSPSFVAPSPMHPTRWDQRRWEKPLLCPETF